MSEPIERLLKFARAGKWADLTKALGRSENLSACAELATTLESWGDASCLQGWNLDAIYQYNGALQCCMVLLYTGPDPEQRAAAAAPYERLNDKLLETKRQLDLEMAADEKGPLEWVAGGARVIELGRQSRDVEAHSLLARMSQLPGVTSDDATRFAEQLERAGDQLAPALTRQLIWFYEKAHEQLRRAGRNSDDDVIVRVEGKLTALRPWPVGSPQARALQTPPPPPPTAAESLVEELANLARNYQVEAWRERLESPELKPVLQSIADQLEALGDGASSRQEWLPAAEYYRVAVYSRYKYPGADQPVWNKLRDTELAIVDHCLANPLLAGDRVSENLGWDDGMRWVEHLALSGRAADADRLLSHLKRITNNRRDQDSPGRMELIGDHVAASRPDLARWFYQKLRDWLSGLPVDTAAQAALVNQVVGEASDKLAAVEARLLQATRVAALRIERSGPSPETSSQEIRHGEILKLDADPFAYRFRARIEPDELWLDQIADEQGRLLSFSAFQRNSVRLRVGGSEDLRPYPRVKQGPEWTIKLTRITTGRPSARS